MNSTLRMFRSFVRLVVRPQRGIEAQLARLNDNLERWLHTQDAPSIDEIRELQESASLASAGRTYVQTMTDEELADAEWREEHGIPEPGLTDRPRHSPGAAEDPWNIPR